MIQPLVRLTIHARLQIGQASFYQFSNPNHNLFHADYKRLNSYHLHPPYYAGIDMKLGENLKHTWTEKAYHQRMLPLLVETQFKENRPRRELAVETNLTSLTTQPHDPQQQLKYPATPKPVETKLTSITTQRHQHQQQPKPQASPKPVETKLTSTTTHPQQHPPPDVFSKIG